MTKTIINVKTRFDVLKVFNDKVMAALCNGYVISDGYTSNNYPRLYLKNEAGEQLKIEMQSTSYKHSFDKEQVSLLVDEIEFATFYSISNSYSENAKYVETVDEIEAIIEKQKQRSEMRYVSFVEKEIKTKKAVTFVKTLPRFRSVPCKNIRITRAPNKLAYTVENVKTRTARVIG